ncbi:hypothetical protein CERZMDRAFT_100237 [Cercospora zeae-maydis SCOH1-5]|uniref:Uncharacterized protein n=1 Tax=Cercospora zeae-maydis SCOH1-5 TaxID=717836 RepID=A0A6A6F7F3_9PEZI|nr:hypothetical protein CERZMDRAFT_100237 [Cercospora zeae-maydis SCOH1-5]
MGTLAAQLGQLNMLDVDNAARAQINMDDLAGSFQSYCITAGSPPASRNMAPSTKHHQLTLVFPCFDIIPQGAKLALEAPCNIEQRERPRKDVFFEHNHPEAMVRLPTYTDVANASIPRFEQENLLESMVERLTLAPGFSTLNVASYYRTDQQTTPTYRFQLLTHWVTSAPNPLFANETQSVEVDAAEWQEIRAQGAKVRWVKLLESHINRATDFSYFRVLERLEQHDPEYARREDSLCNSLFDRAPYPSINHVLKIRLSMKSVRRVIIDSDQDIYELPCGHQFMCNDTYLMCATSEDECLAAKCPECGQKILHKDTDMMRIAMVRDRRAREHYKCEFALLKQITTRFEQEVMVGPAFQATKFSIQCKDFCDALLAARRSFRLPATVMPHTINFVDYPETIVIRDRLVGNLSHGFKPMTVLRRSTMGLLINFATEVLKEFTGVRDAADIWTVLPPSYRGFLIAWFHRALGLAHNKVKRSEHQLSQLAENFYVQKPDDDIKLGYKLDVAVMGKRHKRISLHKSFGDVPLEKTRIPYTFKESDWKREEPEYI